MVLDQRSGALEYPAELVSGRGQVRERQRTGFQDTNVFTLCFDQPVSQKIGSRVNPEDAKC